MTTAADDSAVEDAFEALLAGRAVPEEAAGLAAFTEAVRATATSPGRPNGALAELLATGLLVDQSSPSARTARSAGAPPSRRPRIRIRRRFAVFFPALLAKILSAGAAAQAATGATVVVVAFAGAGAVGVLPGPVQDTFTSIVSDESAEIPVVEAPAEEAPVEEAPEAEVPTEDLPLGETPLEEVPAEDGEFDADAWVTVGPDGYASFSDWVTAGAHDDQLKADLRAQGMSFGNVVSQWARTKGEDPTDYVDEGAEDGDESVTPDAEVSDDGAVDTEGSTDDGDRRGNGNRGGNGNGGNGNGGGGNGNGNGNGNGRN